MIFWIFISVQVTWHNLEHPIKLRSTIKARGDVAARGASDSIVDCHLRRGYVGQSNSSANHFQNDLISAVDQRSYNS